MQGDAVELVLDPGRALVQLLEEVGGEEGAARLRFRTGLFRICEEAAEDQLGAGVDRVDRRRGELDQLAVVGGARPGDEVLEVLLVPDLPGPHRARRDRRVVGPEAAAGAVAGDRLLDEGAPGGLLRRGLDGQRFRRRGAVPGIDQFLRDDPGRGAVEEGEDGDPGGGGLADHGVGRGEVERGAFGRLHRAPGDRHPDAADAAALQALELFDVQRPLRNGAPEVRRNGQRGRRSEGGAAGENGKRGKQGARRPTSGNHVSTHRLARLWRDLLAGALTALPVVHDPERDRGKRRDCDQDRNQRRGTAAIVRWLLLPGGSLLGRSLGGRRLGVVSLALAVALATLAGAAVAASGRDGLVRARRGICRCRRTRPRRTRPIGARRARRRRGASVRVRRRSLRRRFVLGRLLVPAIRTRDRIFILRTGRVRERANRENSKCQQSQQ